MIESLSWTIGSLVAGYGVVLLFDRGLANTLESLAFTVRRTCEWIADTTDAACFGQADRLRRRRVEIEAVNRGKRDAIQESA